MRRSITSSRRPRSGNTALATGALMQAVLGLEFLIAGLSKLRNPFYAVQFAALVPVSPGLTGGPFAGLLQALVVPHLALAAGVTLGVELGAGAILIVTALDVLRRRLGAPLGSARVYEPALALAGALAALLLGGQSLAIFVVQGGRWPTIDPGLAFGTPIPLELLLVPLLFALAALELGRFRALQPANAQADSTIVRSR